MTHNRDLQPQLLLSPTRRRSLAAGAVLLALLVLGAAERPPATRAELAELVQRQDVETIRAQGPGVMPQLVALYRQGDESWRTNLAWIFYRLGWRSEEAKAALIEDVHTQNVDLRLQVQWALGRVSNDDVVVDVLLENLQKDPNPLFREKSACGLASDQVHLTDAQRVRLYERVVALLDAPKIETRWLAMRILETWTGQTKGFEPGASPGARQPMIARWQQWLDEYKANL